jgi:starch-binding outer membrane protein, SusD/RagB family
MKIRNTIFRILAVAALICTSYSCSDDFFTEQPGNRITPDQHFKSMDDLNSIAGGIYTPLQTAMPRLVLVDGLRSDMMDITSNVDPFMKDLNDQNLSINNPYIDGADFYKAIININEIIVHIKEVWINEPTSIPYLPKQVDGALLAFRAWCYFNLIQMYGEAAYIPDNMTTLETNQVILDKKTMIDTLLKQLKPYLAIKSSELQLVNFGPDVRAIAGQLFLENAHYTEYPSYYDSAAFYLQKGLESNDANNPPPYKVSAEYQNEAWINIFRANNGGNENYDFIPYDFRSKQLNSLVYWTLENYNVKPTQIVIDSYNSQLAADTVGDIWRGMGVTIDEFSGYPFITKYYIERGDPYSSRIAYYRAADIHLLLAEALINCTVPDTTAAMALMNDGISKVYGSTITTFPSSWANNIGVRSRVALLQRRIPSNVDKNNADSVKYAIEDLIIQERALELAYEGKRWFDLMRIAERRGKPEYLATKVALKFGNYNVPGSKAEAILIKLKNKANWYLPSK